MIRLPFQPLQDWFTLRHLPPDAETHERERNARKPDDTRMADAFGVTQITVAGWRRCGLTIYTADRVACRLGLHPVHFWPDWYEIPIQTNHGTLSGYQLHRRHRTEPCEPCREALRVAHRADGPRRANAEQHRRQRRKATLALLSSGDPQTDIRSTNA